MTLTRFSAEKYSPLGGLLVPEAALTPASTSTLDWLALSLTPGLGPTRARKLVEHFGSPEAVVRASLTELEAATIQAVSAQSIATGKSGELAREELARAAAAGITVLSASDPLYPRRLKEIYDPPIILYVRGDAEQLNKPGIAMVGTRHPTPYGSGMAERLACDLAAQGLVIISGMARGVDTASHRGAISAKGKTVAVFGTGVDVIYPKENSRLSEQILSFGGALISEFPLGTFAAPQNFPIRNRILSGMSCGVLVVEAAEYSGTRITARLALEQNRDVFAVPGNVTNKNSWGPNTLIKQGAKLVATWEDVWEDLPTEVRLALTPPSTAESQSESSASLFPDDGLPPHERRILSLLKADEATHIDELVEKLESELSSSEIFAALFELELNGKVRQMPGKNFVKSF
ncbi:MAG TPA: DNA-processing protein DprA [Candidatus Sulfotelmatobacter sp.]|nr:DNA-processing protein DprA [Candidatus Sulfotelmatobacter sp.]